MEVIDFMCDCALCMCVWRLYECVPEGSVVSGNVVEGERGGGVYMFQQMSFVLSMGSLGYIFPGANSPSFQGPEAVLGLIQLQVPGADEESLLTAGSQEPSLSEKAHVESREERILSS